MELSILGKLGGAQSKALWKILLSTAQGPPALLTDGEGEMGSKWSQLYRLCSSLPIEMILKGQRGKCRVHGK